MTICLYEDKKYRQFFPLTMLRPVSCLRAGIRPLHELARNQFKNADLSLATRSQISSLTATANNTLPVNIVKKTEGGVLFLNGRIRDYGNLAEQVTAATGTTQFVNDSETVAVLFKDDTTREIGKVTTPENYQALFENLQTVANSQTTATLYNYCWEIMADIDSRVTSDFERLSSDFAPPRECIVHDGVYLLNDEQIYFGDKVAVYPNVVINAEKGPVYIGANTRIEPDVTINGPCYIGPNCQILAGKISSCSIGHTSRVGGEVEESVFHSYVNKYHAGFIGHSYVGSWVNFGAMTTNSDLKNNYSNIRLTLNGESLDSGSIKVGSFIGDHTKFGIGTLLNTGINIGVCCNLYGGSLIADKEVPSFSWGSGAPFDRYQIDKALTTIERTTARRSVTLSVGERELLQAIFDEKFSEEGILSFG